MTTDYNAGDSLTEAVTACTTALSTLQRLGCSDQADPALTEAEAVDYGPIINDPSRSPAWIVQTCATKYINTISTLARRLTAVATTAGRQDADDARNVFGIGGLPGDVASLSIARRDADDRITDIADPATRQALLAQAVRTGDNTLARALVQSAFQFNDADTVNAFIAANPNLADAVERLWTAQNRQTIALDITTSWRLGNLKPAPIHSMLDYEIAAAATGNANAGSWNV